MVTHKRKESKGFCNVFVKCFWYKLPYAYALDHQYATRKWKYRLIQPFRMLNLDQKGHLGQKLWNNLPSEHYQMLA